MKKIILTVIVSLMVLGATWAAEAKDAIFAWVEGSSTCYKLTDIPKVTYNGTTAELRLNGETGPALTLDLAGGKNLKITYGVYVELTSIPEIEAETVPVSVENRNGKFFIQGKLIIVNDGHQYDINGNLIK